MPTGKRGRLGAVRPLCGSKPAGAVAEELEQVMGGADELPFLGDAAQSAEAETADAARLLSAWERMGTA